MTQINSLFINTQSIKSAQAANKIYNKLISKAIESSTLKIFANKVDMEPDLFVSEETGNEYYGVHVLNKFGKTVTTVKIASWNASGNYAFSEKYCGNAAQVARKVKERLLWIAMNEPNRFTEEYDGELAKTGNKKALAWNYLTA